MSSSKSTDRKLRVGIISANWGALAHLPAWRLLDGVEVTSICTSRQETAEAAAKRFDVARPFWNHEEMCADPNIDIIDAGTSPVQRERMVTAALNAGKHVLNQVPFASSLEAAEKLAALQRRRGVKGAAATSLIGLPHLALMKEMIEAGYLGQVFQVHCSWQMSFFLEIYPGFSYTWFGKAGNGTSVTRNQGSHLLHALRYLFGPIESVLGRMQTQLKTWKLPEGGSMDVETDDTCHGLLAFANGAMGTLQTSWTAADSPGFYIDAFGNKGRLRLEALRYPSIDTARLYAAKSAIPLAPCGQEVPVPERLLQVEGRHVAPADTDMFNGGQRVSLGRLFSGFARSIRDNSEPVTTFERSVEIQRIVEALYESNRSRAWIDLPRAAAS
jgi:predicted dehydrogenase